MMPRRKPTPIPPWTDFQRSEFPREHMPERMSDDASDAMVSTEVWLNSRYQVTVFRDVPAFGMRSVVWLSIKTLHRPHHRHDWRDLQRIKNELCGPERDAIEIYPAESRLHDTANQFHLWVLPAGQDLQCGFADRYVSDTHPGGSGSQRPFEDSPEGLNAAAQNEFVRWADR